jgi:alpha-glucosidase
MQLQFTAVHQIPMVGSDVCGFNNNTWVTLCTRWAALGAFQPFYRNHAAKPAKQQEFYLWPRVAASARKNIAIRYKLLDYIYTAFHDQTLTGLPHLSPLFYRWPKDTNTYGIELQYLLGDGLLISPVTDDESTSVTLYLPKEVFYDFYTGDKVQGTGSSITLDDVPYNHVPVHFIGGSIVPMRASSASTTTALRKKNFQITIAPDADGTASGKLYLDDGDSITQPSTSNIKFSYADGTFKMTGTYGYDAGVSIKSIILLGDSSQTFTVNIPLTQDFTKDLS